MKLQDLKISTQLKVGLGAIFVFVVLLGGLAFYQTDSMWQEAQGLYEHPLTVRRAIGEVKADVLSIHRGMKDLVLAGNDQEIQQTLQAIGTYEADAYQQFDILYDRYLGPRSDIDAAYTAFVQWKVIRDETIRLLRAGQVAEVTSRTKTNGVGGAQAEKVLAKVQKISDFATARGDEFYRDAQTVRDDLHAQLVIVLALILSFSIGLVYYLQKGIQDPLKEMASVTEQYRQGKLDARSRFVAANEFGALAASFNNLAETIQHELQTRENAARISDAMLREDDLHAFCQELLKQLVQHTGSQVGAIYLLNEPKTDLAHFESIGLSAAGRASFSASAREGEFGAALATRQIQHITEISADTQLNFSAVVGDLTLREIMTIPILSGNEVVAVISLATVRIYTAPAVRLINDIWGVLSARMNGVLALRQVREFNKKLEDQNQELIAQQRELATQADELTEQNTELEMQKKQLDQANRLKSSFLSNMSHELRTPLNSVIALSGVLNRRLRHAIPADEYSYIEVIERNGKHLLSLINDILDLSRIEAGREEIALDYFSVRELVNEIVAMIEPHAREKNIALLNRVDGAQISIHSDPVKCRHILQNIIGNAVKFTEVGKVEISAEQVDHAIHITVADTGIGIAADQMPHIFDEFRQADESTSRKYGGTGLGLAIAKKYALMLRGDIMVSSTPGKGSIFTIRLPLTISSPTAGEAKMQPRFSSRESSPAHLVPAGQSQTILLVEDSEPAVIQITDMLTEQGYRIVVARNGREALEQIEKTLPDAMILDLMMPEVDGFQVLRTIRGAEKTAHLPVLILTAKQITREELNFLKGNNVHQLIQKGDVSKTELLSAVGEMVAPRPATPNLSKVRPVRTPPAGKPVILVVEDNPDSMKTVEALLKDTYTLIQAADGQAGIEQARNFKPDLILMDLALPNLDGFAALDAIKSDESLRHVPVIAVTASAMKGNREEILAHGFDGYISKPIDVDVLEKTITDMIYGH